MTQPNTMSSAVAQDALYEELAADLLWLCSIASPIGEEAALCDALVQRLGALPLPAPIRRYGQSIVVPVVRLPASSQNDASPTPHVVLLGHLDTVRTENGPARIEGDRIFGSGAADMKSGLAIMNAVAKRYASQGMQKANVTLVYYAREEGPFVENELGPVLEQDPELRTATFAICLEPSDNRLQLGCCGALHATITFRGKTCHSARPWEGENAISKAAGFLSELAQLAPEPCNIDGYLFQSVMTVTQAKDGGRSRNVVPDSFALNLNYRFAPSISTEQAQTNVLARVAGRADVVFTDISPGCLPFARHVGVLCLRNAGVSVVMSKQAWTDVARLAAAGIPAVNFGPGENAQAHQRHESTSLSLVRHGFDLTDRFLREFDRAH
jgi:succinyl-diaminopimelate desuccinylase